jgi:hypothetical protein
MEEDDEDLDKELADAQEPIEDEEIEMDEGDLMSQQSGLRGGQLPDASGT